MMVREIPQCAGPVEVRQEYRSRVPLPSRATIIENQRQYKCIQDAIGLFYARTGELKLAVPPPCTSCPVDVFHYCETTGAECKLFRIYASGVKGANDGE